MFRFAHPEGPEVASLDFALFEAVDLVVDRAQLLVVRGAEVAAAGGVGDLLEGLW